MRSRGDEEDGSNRTRTYAIILAILLLLLAGGRVLPRPGNLGYLGGSASFNLPSVAGQPVAQATPP